MSTIDYKPADYGIDGHYRHWRGDTAEDAIGPFFFHPDPAGAGMHTAFRAEARHCNAHSSVHGGVLMTFADYTLCLAANGGAAESVATVTQNCEFAAPAFAGDILRGEAEVLRSGRRMLFVRGVLRRDDGSDTGTVVMNASAVIMRLKQDKREVDK